MGKITLEQIIELIPKSLELAYVDRDESLDHLSNEIVEAVLKGNNQPLYKHIDDISFDFYSCGMEYQINDLIESVSNKFDISKNEAENIVLSHQHEIEDEMYERDTSNLMKDLLKNTRHIPVRIEMPSNYDVINSNYLEEAMGGYSYEGSYLKDMIDALKLNPSKVKEALDSHGLMNQGEFPSIPEREGCELVSYKSLAEELQNNNSGALLTFVGTIDPMEVLDKPEGSKVIKVKIPKGNRCGLFNDWQGSGSVVDMMLLQDVTLQISDGFDKDFNPFFRIMGDNEGYGINQSFGVDRCYFGREIYLTFNDNA
jgi:hypothetical protein